MQLKALTKSATGMTDEQCEADKMPALRGGRELTTTQVAERPSNPWGEPNEVATPRQVGARNDKRAWRWCKEAAIQRWRRDLDLQVSSLFLASGAETSSDLSCGLVSAAGHGSPSLRGTTVPKQSRSGMRLPRPFSGARNDRSAGGFDPELRSGGGDGCDEQNDYLCPPSILSSEDAGRWWATNNTSNIPGVE
jgi:hypothetical protein